MAGVVLYFYAIPISAEGSFTPLEIAAADSIFSSFTTFSGIGAIRR